MSVAGAPTVAAEPKQAKVSRRARAKQALPARVSFPELVWAHHLRQEELRKGRPYEGDAERRYREFEAGFERRYGAIVNSYWSTATASGAAVTVKHRPWVIPDDVRLHWATDWAASQCPPLDDLLFDCESLAVRISEVLRDTSQRVAMQWLFTIVGHCLGALDGAVAKDKDALEKLVAHQRTELKKIETYYQHAAVRSGQIVYLAGALLGILPPIALAVLTWLIGLLDQTGLGVRTGFFCFAAGAVGALVSVMSRMNSGKVTVDWEFGKDTLRTMGSLRPFVGGIFGLAAYFALKSGVVDLSLAGAGKDNVYFYVLFAFAAGFSERLAQDMLLGSTLDRFKKPEGPPRQGDEPLDAGLADPQPGG